MTPTERELLFAEFDDLISEHWIFDSMCALLRSETIFPRKKHLTAIVGAGGVGKSAVRHAIAVELNKKILHQETNVSPFIHCLEFECPEPVRNVNYWIRFMRFLLKEMKESTLIPTHYPCKKVRTRRPLSREERRLRRSYEYLKEKLKLALHHRKVKVLLVDEAAHILRVVGPDQFFTQLEILKAICDDLGIILILIGPPELLALSSVNSQVSWRLDMRSFPAYRLDREDHLVELYSLLGRFEKKMSELGVHGLEKYEDMIVTSTAGCVGLMKSWCMGITARVIGAGRDTVTETDLKIEKKTSAQLSTTISEIEQVRTHFDDELIAVTEEYKPDRKGLRRKSRVGSRNPARDPVGTAL